MRELKFRVWCKRTQEYHKPIDEEDYDADDENYWLQMCIDTNGRLYSIETTDEDTGFEYVGQDCEIIDGEDAKYFIIEQYTGLKDKNGKEIYEGDILGGIWESGFISWCEKCKQFQYHGAGIGCMACSGDVHWCEIVEDDGKLEVIGNIHENPELLEEEE